MEENEELTRSDSDDVIDVAIIGAGPAGLSAALYCARGGLRTVIFGDPYNSQLAKAGIVENFLTWRKPGTQGLEIAEAMLMHALDWDAVLVEKEIRKIPTFIIKDASGTELGRIIESPKYGSLEQDLLAIAKGEYDKEIQRNALHDYVDAEKEFRARYERYQPELPLIKQIREALPKARVVAVNCRHSRECIRYIPRLARMSEHLPDWEFDVYEHNTEDIAQRFQVKALPTFIVFSPDGKELGRIAGKPSSESLEKEFLLIATS